MPQFNGHTPECIESNSDAQIRILFLVVQATNIHVLNRCLRSQVFIMLVVNVKELEYSQELFQFIATMAVLRFFIKCLLIELSVSARVLDQVCFSIAMATILRMMK